ncbi:hypothetical protein AGMMS49525_00920 [Bacteroidia bacterium]|nr:hypothetical protein AGMMS49525_00920 [Bacteroidia bacterium]
MQAKVACNTIFIHKFAENMKTLDLNACGVSEMSSAQMRNVNGGLAPIMWLLIGIVVSECLDRHAAADFAEGFNDARSR